MYQAAFFWLCANKKRMNVKTKIFRWVEICLVYIGLPLLYFFDIIVCHKMVPLLAVFVFYLYVIIRDKTIKRRQFNVNRFKAWRLIFLRSIIIGLFLIIYVSIWFPEQFYQMPTERTRLWLYLIFLYPFWSVLPQEFIYRVYFYHRFKGLVNNRNVLVLLNALLFSFCHIIFRNYVALVLTFLAGIIFSLTYLRHRSFTIVSLEHAIYGSLIFTIGPGDFFYLP